MFRLPSLEDPIHVCSRAKVAHVHAQPSKVRGAVLVAAIAARITPLTPPPIHSCDDAARNERMLAALGQIGMLLVCLRTRKRQDTYVTAMEMR